MFGRGSLLLLSHLLPLHLYSGYPFCQMKWFDEPGGLMNQVV